MISSLFADIWDNDYNSPTKIIRIGPVSPQVSWRNPGGLQRFYITLPYQLSLQYKEYVDWVGLRLIIYDGFCDRPIMDGTIIDIGMQSGFLTLLAVGPWWRLWDDYEKDNPALGDFTSTTITTALINHAGSVIASDMSNVESTAVSSYGFILPVQGMHVGRLIEEMMLAGDGKGQPLIFWFEFPQFGNDGKPQKPVAHMIALSTTESIDWQIYAKNRTFGASSIHRDIGDIATSITAIYNNAGTTAETNAATNNVSIYWTRKRAISARGATVAMAMEVRDTELTRLSNPQIRRNIVIGSAQIMDKAGQKWPLWRILISGGYLGNNDVGPDKSLFSTSLDYKRVGRITDMQYDHEAHRLSISLNKSIKLDSMLASLGYNWRLADQLSRELTPTFS